MAGNKAGPIKLASVIRPTRGVTSSATCHGRVRLKATQHDTSQHDTEEEPSFVWRAIRDDHGRRLIRTRPVCADKVRVTGS